MVTQNSTTPILIDTSYLLALSFESDEHYQRATELSIRLDDIRARLVVTRAVLLEVGDALSRSWQRDAALRLLYALEADPIVEIIELPETLYHEALGLFRSRPDKDWGLSDCASFVVMEQRGITDALMADRHFLQAGYRALLVDDA